MRWKCCSLAQIAVLLLVTRHAFAQEHGGMQMPMPSGHEHQIMAVLENPLGIDHTRDGSGTSWLPDASPMQGLMRQRGSWMLRLHGNAFVQYIEAGGDRGDHQFGSINWVMGMAQRELGGGQLLVKTMFSLEPATVGRCGYPTLFASGEQCRGVPLHDKQHPHDVFMEVAAEYRRKVGDALAVADLWRSSRRARSGSHGLSASAFRRAESHRARVASLAGFDARQFRRRHGRSLRTDVEGRGVRVQRPRARRSAIRLRYRRAGLGTRDDSGSCRRRRGPCRCPRAI